jgi:hypothetical protein
VTEDARERRAVMAITATFIVAKGLWPEEGAPQKCRENT